MKGFMILAVTSLLVGVQASSRVQTVLDIDESKTVESQWIFDEVDGTSANDALDEVQNIKNIVDMLHLLQNYKDGMRCSVNTCEWCVSSACFNISYVPSRNEFQSCAAYNSINVFCQSVPARSFKSCKTIQVSILNIELCSEAMNVNIDKGKACMDVKVSVAGMASKICLAPPSHFNIA
ncbi:hypothetical protein ACJMK2_024356 [Sinanodonta woodiana]|uniref:Uncharacterized protein n=1 Tax=Sinanodonta woodiana TaxID=1069815 RepID=A0ABD3T833_SINWO